MIPFFAEALLDVLERAVQRCKPKIKDATEWLRQAATPPSNLTFTASDGAYYSGVVVLERSRAVLMFAVRALPPANDQRASHPEPLHSDPSRYAPSVRPRDLFEDDADDRDPSRDPFFFRS